MEMSSADKKVMENLNRDRLATVNNIKAIIEEIGAMPDPLVMVTLRLDAVLDDLFGSVRTDDEGKEFVEGSPRRMEFENAFQRKVLSFMQDQRENAIRAVEEMAAQQRKAALLQGVAGAPMQTPNPMAAPQMPGGIDPMGHGGS